jgi:hypothetical protein
VKRRQPDDGEEPRQAREQRDAPAAIAESSQGRGDTTPPPLRITGRDSLALRDLASPSSRDPWCVESRTSTWPSP